MNRPSRRYTHKPRQSSKRPTVDENHIRRMIKYSSIYKATPWTSQPEVIGLKRCLKPADTVRDKLFRFRDPVVLRNDPLAHHTMNNEAALKGVIHDTLPTHPRLANGEVMPLVDMSIGSRQAGTDMGTYPIGEQQMAVNLKPGMQNRARKIPFTSF
jgi:hypothetical protein